MKRMLNTPEQRAFWSSVDESYERIKKMPYSLIGGSSAEEEDRLIIRLKEAANIRFKDK